MAKEIIFNNYYVCGQTDTGLMREHNEDNILINTSMGLLLVADGIGGHDAGEVASLEAIQLIDKLFQQYLLPHQNNSNTLKPTVWQKLRTLLGFHPAENTVSIAEYQQIAEDILIETNKHVFQLNQERKVSEGTGMGTTIVGVLLIAATQQLLVFHIGDSRLYRFTKQHKLEQITKDHSVLQVWIDNGAIGTPPNSNIILQAIGPYPSIQPSVQLIDINAEQDACFLLCSDGLSDMLDEQMLTASLAELESDSLEDVVQRLVDTANNQGGKDNISAIILQTASKTRS
ncbi:MAG: SpoIIE family protein phosphatase [Methyloprofundus sp.]|nr:SpoIIE family protein phosphatase [Methyloprofundus sp.]